MSNNDSLNKDDQMANYVSKALEMISTYSRNEVWKFYEWVNRIEYIAKIIGVPNNKMLEFFNNMVDNDFHSYVKMINPSVNFSELSYEETLEHYQQIFISTSDTNLHRLRFLSRNQYEEEPMEIYADCLFKICNKCNYTDYIKERLCEQFIKGIRDNNIRTHLSNTPLLSFKETVAKAIELEKSNEIIPYLRQALSIIHIYHPEIAGTFYVWLNKFEYVADIIGVPKDTMLPFLNKMVHKDFHASVQRLYSHIKFSELSYDEVIDNFLRYFALPDEQFLHRNRFMCRNQYEKETIQKYADSLQKIYNKCNYRSSLKKELYEQFVRGIRNDELRTLLRNTSELSFSEAVTKAIEFEKANDLSPFEYQALSMIHTYHPKKEGTFYVWLNKFEYVADIISVPKNKMLEFFNKMVTNDCHTSVQKLYSDINFSELSYEEIISYYLRYFTHRQERSSYRKRFKIRNQYEQETIEKYAVSLRKISNKCNFTKDIEKRLCNQFIIGIRDLEIKTHLRNVVFPNFDQAVEKAIELREKEKNSQKE